MALKKKDIEQGIVRFLPLGGCTEGVSKPFTILAEFYGQPCCTQYGGYYSPGRCFARPPSLRCAERGLKKVLVNGA